MQKPTVQKIGLLMRPLLALIAAKFFLEGLYPHIPQLQPRHCYGIISTAALSQTDNRQNYLIFLICLAVTTLGLIAADCFRIRKSLSSNPESTPPKAKKEPWLAWLSNRLTAFSPWIWGISLLALGVWTLNVEFVDLSSTITDAFHEGEYLGFGTSILQSAGPFSSAFFIHGWGISAFPELLAHWLGVQNNGIAFIRFIRMLESCLPWLGAACVLQQIAFATWGKKKAAFPYLLILLLFLLACFSCYELTLRRAVSLFQLAGLLAFLRGSRERPSLKHSLLALMLGLSLPLGCLYNYSEACIFFALYGLAGILVLFQEGKAAWYWWLLSLTGIVLGAIGVGLLFGPAEVLQMLEQITYWARYGREIWFLPLTFQQFHTSTVFWLEVFVPCLTIAYLFGLRKHYSGIREAINANGLLIILLFSALLGDKVGLDRALADHLAWSGVNTTLLLIALGGIVFRSLPKIAGERVQVLAIIATLLLIGVRAAGNNGRLFSPITAMAHIKAYAVAIPTPDANILAGKYRFALDGMGQEIAKTPYFYTLTSEGIWYYLFKKPSASHFHQLVYARAPEAQKMVVEELERNRPEYILVSAPKIKQDIPLAKVNPLVYPYILKHYRPYKILAGQSFWKRKLASRDELSQLETKRRF